MSLRAFVTVIAASLLVASLAEAQDRPTLHVRPIEISKDGTGVQFASPEAIPSEVPEGVELDDLTEKGLFLFDVDISNLRWSGDSVRHYLFYVRPAKSPRVFKFKVKAKPRGRFQDRRETVSFDVSYDSLTDTGTVRLPLVAQYSDPPALIQKDRDRIQHVPIQGERKLPIELANTLSDSPIEVQVPPAIKGDESLWQVLKGDDEAKVVTIAPGKTAVVNLIARARPISGLRTSFPPSLPEKAHTAISLEFTYSNPSIKERTDVVNADIRIRFAPDLTTLAVALLLGVGLGTVIAPFVPHGSTGRVRASRTRILVVATVTAVILELIGMFLVAYDSRLVLFGLELDPSQTLPAIIVGVIAGAFGARAPDLLPFKKAASS